MHDASSLLEEATKKLQLPWAARRFFTTDGIEIAALHQIKPETILVVSTGDDFKPRKASGPRARSAGRSSAIASMPYQYPSLSAAALEGAPPDDNLKSASSHIAKRPAKASAAPRRMHHVRRCSVRLNDGGRAPDRAVVQAASWQGLCDDAAIQLGLPFSVTRLFTINGLEVTSISQV